MGQPNGSVVFLIAVAVFLIFFHRRWMLDALIDAIHNFRGGPPTPMHPSPANDGVLLRRRSRG
jgi:hypothetical protein